MFERFYEKYAAEEQEAMVLVRDCVGAGKNGDFWEMTAISLGMVFCADNRTYIGEGRLKWPVTEEERNTKKGWGRLGNEEICRVKVRKLLDRYVPQHTSAEQFNGWCITEVLERKASCPVLEAVLEEYKKPVVLEDQVLGTLTLNRKFHMFETTLSWNGKEISLMLDIDLENQDSWESACAGAKEMATRQKEWDERMRGFAAEQLTELANDWLAEEKEEEAASITQETFAERIALSELSVASDGNFTAYYDDDDMFWGHAVEVRGSLKEGPNSANIVG